MGVFCTITALTPFLKDVEITDLTTTLDEAVLEAETQIRSALAPRYDVGSAYFQTSTSTPPQIATICKQLALGHVHEALSRGGKEAFQRADRYKKRGEELLKALVDRTSDLVDSSGDLIEERTDAYMVESNTTDYKTTFDEADPVTWGPDNNKLDDIANERDAAD